MLFVTVSAMCGDFESGGIVYSFTGRSLEVAVDQNIINGINSYSGIYIIPSTVNFEGTNYNVIAIADRAFAGSNVTEVVIPNSVKELGEGAFANAYDLQSVTLPLYIDQIPAECFAGTAIVNIAVPEGVIEVETKAFKDCEMLHTVMLPSSLNYIGSEAFGDCHNLYEIYCSSPVPPIVEGADAFDGVKNVDLVLADYETVDFYLDDPAWGSEEIFTMFPNEDITALIEYSEDVFNQDWKRVNVGNHLAYKVFDENDELVALTAADNLYLPALDHDATYSIVATTIMGDSDPIYVTVEKTTGIDEFIDNAFPPEPEPIIIARQGTLYVYGDNYRRLLSVWDMAGRLYYVRMSSDAQVIDLPRNRVYIVKLGNYVKKVFI